MTDEHAHGRETEPTSFERAQARTPFLPDLCSTSSVFLLVLVGELLAFALSLDRRGLAGLSMPEFGLTSFLIQWVLLSSAALLCLFRSRLNALGPAKAFTLSYLTVLAFTALYSLVGIWFLNGLQGAWWSLLVSNVLISAVFAGILLRYLYIQQQLKQRERAELGARVLALQSRIRPHFLFNSLNSIASLISIKPETAEKLVVDLAQLFRASLSMPQLTPIQRELELCRRFADIEQLRLGARLKIDWNVETLPDDAQILNLILQPLLENAIYHGIQPLPKGGVIDIEVKEVKGDIVVKLTNPRLPGDATEGRHIQMTVRSEGAGIALSNIRARLEAYYGERARLRVVKGETDFTVVLRYPLRMNERFP